MKCPKCNTENADGMKFCGECGTKLPEPMNHCPNCNKDWPLTMKFCGECGFKFGGESSDSKTATSNASSLTISEKMELENARDQFYETGNFAATYPVVKKIWENKPEDENAISLFLPLLAYDGQACVEFCEGLDDLLAKHPAYDNSIAFGLGFLFILVKIQQLDSAEVMLKEIKNMDSAKENFMVICHEALFYLALFKKYKKNEFLEQAEGLINGIKASQDKLENTWRLLLANILNNFKGNEKEVYDEDFCKENNVYHWFVNSNIFDLYGADTSDFVEVEGGVYAMGSDQSLAVNIPEEQTPEEQIPDDNNSEVQGEFIKGIIVSVDDLYVCKHPVTQEEYSSIMGKTSCAFNSNGVYPVTSITWYDAIEYCNKRSEKEGLVPYYNIDKEHKTAGGINDEYSWTITENVDSDGYRLPTQEEWEYVARGGKLSKGYKYAGGNVLDEVAFTGVDMNNCPEICQKKPNELGIFDMGGLLDEYCYPRKVSTSKDGTTRFVVPARGMPFMAEPSEHIVAWEEKAWYTAKGFYYTNGYSPDGKANFAGFRVVRSKLR